ncbi:MAG: ubiquinol-cytochrome c reductase iron-sulfur subunit [Gemmatimonadota bacterium]|nr:ubiquinol-cytochrome c reductase iron-sulfur subunit [Gemmatimonadota bacterium]
MSRPDSSPGPGPDRRRFVNWLLGTSAGGVLLSVFYPVVRYIVPPQAAESATGSVTLPFGPGDIGPNEGRPFRFGNRPGLLIRTPSGDLRAFSAVCTHLACTVQYRSDDSRIWCACHNGYFDLNGTNVQGPPPRPLDRFEVNVRGEEIVVSQKA